MTWSKGQPWRVVRSLQRLNEQIRAAYPSAVPPATPAAAWGSIADSAHSTTSDHYPHYYSALGSTAVVCARDFPHAPALGLDAHALAERLRVSRDPRIGYVISNGRITGPNRSWQWGSYSGSDPHDTHIHVSTVHTAAADDPRDWTIGEDDDMTPEEHKWLETVHRNLTVLDGRNPVGQIYTRATMGTDHTDPAFKVQHPSLKSLGSQLTTMQTALLGAVQGLDTKAILARINEVAAAETERELAAAQRDAELRTLVEAGQSGELTAEQVLTKLRDLLPAGEPANPTQ